MTVGPKRWVIPRRCIRQRIPLRECFALLQAQTPRLVKNSSEKIGMILYIDGGCSANGQRDIQKRRMVMVVTDAYGAVLSERYETGGSNNIAELLALRDALRWCRDRGYRAVEIHTDSRNNLSWTFGKKVGRQINDRPLVLAIREEIAALRVAVSLTLTWVPRAYNEAGHYIERMHGL